MRKFLALLLCVLLCLCIFGCGQVSREKNSEKLNIVCTVFPQYDFVRALAGDKVNLKMLVPLGTESHDFKLENMSVADIRAVADADLVIYVGGTGDNAWISELKTKVENNALWLPLTEMTENLPELASNNMHHAHDHGDHDEACDGEEIDEHVWTSPLRTRQIVKNITDVL